METTSRAFRVSIGVLSGLWVPFAVTAVYRLVPDGLPYILWSALPFAVLGLFALGVWRFTQYRNVAIGIFAGVVVYGILLQWLVWEIASGPQV